MHKNFGRMENLTSGKGWAAGYEQEEIKKRSKKARHFDFRRLRLGRRKVS